MGNALTARLKLLENRLVSDTAFRGVLTFDRRTESPAAAVARATRPGIYAMHVDAGDTLYLCAIAANGTAVLHTPDGKEIAPW